MSKKEFTEERPKRLDDLSDIELIEHLDKGTGTTAEREVTQALLDRRLKIVLNDLKEATKKNIQATEKYNDQLVSLTRVLVWLTFAMAVGVGLQIYLAFKAIK